jgi:hypothetical protein
MFQFIRDLKNVANAQSTPPTNIVTNKELSTTKCFSLIPMHVYVTWYTLDLPPHMRRNYDRLRHNDPEMTFHLYDDSMCRQFIVNHFPVETVYAYDHLRPGAYRADLWRYCVLYIHGGIYLDCKYACCTGFKLSALTGREYWVRDTFYRNIEHGIYNALMVSFPKNRVCKRAIDDITFYVANKIHFENSELRLTGPHLLSRYFTQPEILEFPFYFDEPRKKICRNDGIDILEIYPEYFTEKHNGGQKPLYFQQWNSRNVYKYRSLAPYLRTQWQRTETQMFQNIPFHASNLYVQPLPAKVRQGLGIDAHYFVILRWINYQYKENGSKVQVPKKWLSRNSYFYLDANFHSVSPELFFHESSPNLADIRTCYFNDTFYYIGSISERQTTNQTCAPFQLPPPNQQENNDNQVAILPLRTILPTMYDTHLDRRQEKNWSFVTYLDELHVVYHWYPLQVGKIDEKNASFSLVFIHYDVPYFFKNARGTSNATYYKEEIWFLLHKSQAFYINAQDICYRYSHFFAVFDKHTFAFLRHSEEFVFHDSDERTVEFCMTLHILTGNDGADDQILFAHSYLDKVATISTMSMNHANDALQWFVRT